MEKPGYKTTEFWMATITNIVAAVIPILVLYGVMTHEEGQLWYTLILAIAAPVVAVIVMGFVSRTYINSRTEIKTESMRLENVNK